MISPSMHAGKGAYSEIKNYSLEIESESNNSLAQDILNRLPDHLLILILSYIGQPDYLFNVCYVSNRLNRLASSDLLWTPIYFNLLVHIYPSRPQSFIGGENTHLLSFNQGHKWYDPTLSHAKQRYIVMKRRYNAGAVSQHTINIPAPIEDRRYTRLQDLQKSQSTPPLPHKSNCNCCAAVYKVLEKLLIIFPVIFISLVGLKAFKVKYIVDVPWFFLMVPMVVFVLCVCLNIVIYTIYATRKSA